MKFPLALLGALGLGALAGPAAACFTVYGEADRVLYQASEPPVDMSQPLRPALAQRFGGPAHMVFEQGECRQPAPVAASAGAGAPLLTDRDTAEQMNVPHQVVAGEIVLVPAHVASRLRTPALTVVPAVPETTLAAAPNTRVMGAGAARPARTQTVITELRDPPLTIIERETVRPAR